MVRRLTAAIGLMMSLLAAREAAAVPITPTDFDGLVLGGSVVPTTVSELVAAMPPPESLGLIINDVYLSEGEYTYVHTVVPTGNNNTTLTTEFAVAGFTGTAGWSYSDSASAGGAGAGDFSISEIDGQLQWVEMFNGTVLSGGWDADEPITFFFVSTKPPGLGDYNLISREAGTGTSYAPVPEPGSIALFGSGLVGFYAAMRRRRNRKA
jgi:hypothetical protein